MRAELDSLGNDRDALSWAIGCVVAGAKERISTMLAPNLKVSRWILIAEMLLCFVPLTVLWLDAVSASSGLVQLHGDVARNYFFHAPGGRFALATTLAGAILGTLGPLSLIAAFRFVVAGRFPSSRWLPAALIAGPALYGVLTLLARLAMAGTGGFGFGALDSFDFWSGILLLSALPSLGALHMRYLASRKPHESPAST